MYRIRESTCSLWSSHFCHVNVPWNKPLHIFPKSSDFRPHLNTTTAKVYSFEETVHDTSRTDTKLKHSQVLTNTNATPNPFPLRRILLENLVFTPLAKKFPTFHVLHQMSLVHHLTSHPISVKYILILSSHLCLYVPRGQNHCGVDTLTLWNARNTSPRLCAWMYLNPKRLCNLLTGIHENYL